MLHTIQTLLCDFKPLQPNPKYRPWQSITCVHSLTAVSSKFLSFSYAIPVMLLEYFHGFPIRSDLLFLLHTHSSKPYKYLGTYHHLYNVHLQTDCFSFSSSVNLCIVRNLIISFPFRWDGCISSLRLLLRI